MDNRSALVAGALALACPPASAHADPLPILIVTGTAAPAPAAGRASPLSVLGGGQVDLHPPSSAGQLLRRLPGVHVDRGEGLGGAGSLYLRGADPNFTLVMVDGVRVNDPTNSRGGSFDWSELDPSLIERVELVPGPLSAVYGSDAMAGAVNIVTRPASGSGARFSAETGSRGRRAASASFAGGEGIDLRAAVGLRDYGETDAGSGRLDSFHASLGKDLAGGARMALGLRYSDLRQLTFPEDSGGPELAVLRDLEQRHARQWTSSAELARTPEQGLGYRLRFSRADRRESDLSPGVAPGLRDPFGIPPSSSDSDYRRDETLGTVTWSSPRYVATFGLQHARETGRLAGFLQLPSFPVPTRFDLTRETRSVLTELQYRPDAQMSLVAGVRRDAADGFDAAVSPRLGVSYLLAATGTGLRANWGKGYKLPSFFALGHPIVGNPDLLPEHSRSVDLGFSRPVLGKGSLAVDIFRSRYTDAIDFDPGPPPRLVNRSGVSVRGAEVKFTWTASAAWEWNATLSHARTRIDGSGEELRNRPRHSASLGATWYPGPKSVLDVSAVYTGSQLDSSIPTGPRRLAGHLRVDVAYSRETRAGVKWFVTVDNLFDRRYEEYVGFRVPGIGARIGVAWEIGR